MSLSRAKFFFLIGVAILGNQTTIYAMQSPLMPLFEPSSAGQAIMGKGTPVQGLLVMSDPNDVNLPKEFREKLELFRAALMQQDYPSTMESTLEKKILSHIDVMEAILTRSAYCRPDSRNEYIRALFIKAAQVGNIDALIFFIDKGVKINEIRYGWNDENALDWAIRKNHEEAKKLLLLHGAKPTPGIEKKWREQP